MIREFGWGHVSDLETYWCLGASMYELCMISSGHVSALE